MGEDNSEELSYSEFCKNISRYEITAEAQNYARSLNHLPQKMPPNSEKFRRAVFNELSCDGGLFAESEDGNGHLIVRVKYKSLDRIIATNRRIANHEDRRAMAGNTLESPGSSYMSRFVPVNV